MICLETTADGMRRWWSMWHAEQEIAEWERLWQIPGRLELDKWLEDERKNSLS